MASGAHRVLLKLPNTLRQRGRALFCMRFLLHRSETGRQPVSGQRPSRASVEHLRPAGRVVKFPPEYTVLFIQQFSLRTTAREGLRPETHRCSAYNGFFTSHRLDDSAYRVTDPHEQASNTCAQRESACCFWDCEHLHPAGNISPRSGYFSKHLLRKTKPIRVHAGSICFQK